MRVAAVISDLMLFSRIESAAAAANASLMRLDSPGGLMGSHIDLAMVDWSAREPGWADDLAAWSAGAPDARLILFGRHTDLEAHADARAAGLGPMWARSKLLAALASLVADSSIVGSRAEAPPSAAR